MAEQCPHKTLVLGSNPSGTTSYNKSNEKKAKQLGIPFGTATAKLRKMILFKLIQETDNDKCYRCQEKIVNTNELSIDHKIPWLDNDTNLFWDLENITFSHLECNIKASRNNPVIKYNDSEFKCCKCKIVKPLTEFHKNKCKKRDIHTICKVCRRVKLKEDTE